MSPCHALNARMVSIAMVKPGPTSARNSCLSIAVGRMTTSPKPNISANDAEPDPPLDPQGGTPTGNAVVYVPIRTPANKHKSYVQKPWPKMGRCIFEGAQPVKGNLEDQLPPVRGPLGSCSWERGYLPALRGFWREPKPRGAHRAEKFRLAWVGSKCTLPGKAHLAPLAWVFGSVRCAFLRQPRGKKSVLPPKTRTHSNLGVSTTGQRSVGGVHEFGNDTLSVFVQLHEGPATGFPQCGSVLTCPFCCSLF